MPQDKVVPMGEAVARFVPDGASVCMGTALEALIPFAAGHEMIRQRRRDLTLIGLIDGVADWKGFLSTLGPEAREAVRVKKPRLSEPLDYGA